MKYAHCKKKCDVRHREIFTTFDLRNLFSPQSYSNTTMQHNAGLTLRNHITFECLHLFRQLARNLRFSNHVTLLTVPLLLIPKFRKETEKKIILLIFYL